MALGLLYQEGRGVGAVNYSRALELFEKAHENGLSRGSCNLGAMYANGQGVRQDLVKAYGLCAEAAEMGGADMAETCLE